MTGPAPAIHTDVLVVGAGPTGLLLANLLGGMGVAVTVVERNADTVQEPRAVSIDDESMRALQAAGLAEAVAAITARGYGSLYKGPSGRVFATVKPSRMEYGFEKRNAFQQPDFEALLRRGLTRFPTVAALFATEHLGFAQDAGGVTARVQGAGGEARTIQARYLVGCDGGRSPIRKALGIALQGSTFEEPWLIVDLVSTRNRCFHTEVFCDPARPCITLPGPGGIRRYEFKLHRGETPETAVEEAFVRRLLDRVGPDTAEPFRRVRVYTFHARIAERWRDRRVFLAGDAAHLTPPFAGQGMNSGLRDAHNLAWKLAEALRRDDAEPLLDSYQTERKPHAWEMIQLALRMGQVMMPASRLRGALVRAAFRGLGLWPQARDYVAQMKYKPKPRFRAGLIWPDGTASRHGLVGQMIPQPLVETPDRRQLLLDAVLPDRPVALVFAERPDEALTAAARTALEAAGAAVIGLTPEWTNPVAADFPIVRDKGRLLSGARPAGDLDTVLLLRRDRYVAAAAAVARAGDLLAPLQALTRPQNERNQRPAAASPRAASA